MNAPPYIIIQPEDPRYRKIITASVQSNDRHVLAAIRGRIGQPIHYVTNWFYYALMTNGHPTNNAVEIWSPQTRLHYAKLMGHQEDEESAPKLILLNAYNFLK